MNAQQLVVMDSNRDSRTVVSMVELKYLLTESTATMLTVLLVS